MKELPAVRRTQPITKKAKISSTTHVHCYNGYMVNNNNKQKMHLYIKRSRCVSCQRIANGIIARMYGTFTFLGVNRVGNAGHGNDLFNPCIR